MLKHEKDKHNDLRSQQYSRPFLPAVLYRGLESLHKASKRSIIRDAQWGGFMEQVFVLFFWWGYKYTKLKPTGWTPPTCMSPWDKEDGTGGTALWEGSSSFIHPRTSNIANSHYIWVPGQQTHGAEEFEFTAQMAEDSQLHNTELLHVCAWEYTNNDQGIFQITKSQMLTQNNRPLGTPVGG